MKTKLAVLASLFLSATALAEPSYDYVQLGYVDAEYDEINMFELGGFQFEGSFEFSDQFFTQFQYRDLDDSAGGIKLDEQQWKFGAGYFVPLTSQTTWDVMVNYGELDVDGASPFGSVSGSTDYYGFETNVRHQFNNNAEIFAGVEWQDWDLGDNQTGYNLGMMYHANVFTFGVEYSKFSDSDELMGFVRYRF